MIIRDLDDAEYQRKVGAHLIQKALGYGWDPTEGEGAFEFVIRKIYETAVEDLVDGHWLALSHSTAYRLAKEPREEQT